MYIHISAYVHICIMYVTAVNEKGHEFEKARMGNMEGLGGRKNLGEML